MLLEAKHNNAMTHGIDYDTIRNAIAKGMNKGSFSTTNNEDVVKNYEWRLLGDIVEIKMPEIKTWFPLSVGDLDFMFSGGVFAQKEEHITGWSMHNEVN